MRFLKRLLKFIFVLVLIAALLYLAGPKPNLTEISKSIPTLNEPITNLDYYIASQERNVPAIKEDNQARIVWYDSTKTKTEFSLVYLHGFSASQGEGFPIHEEFAKRYGCNMFLARLPGHGQADSTSMKGLTSQDLVRGAKEAIAIGRLIGEKVIVMSTSTGGTLALYLASGNDIHSLILYSPNIAVRGGGASALTGPWGKQLAMFSFGSEYVNWGKASGPDSLYWTRHYHMDGLIAMQDLIDQSMMPATFREIKVPVFLGYYYKNEEEQDPTVSVEKMKWMFERLGTEDALKMEVAFPSVGEHVIASEYKSHDVEAVQTATYKFADEILNLNVK